MSDRDLPLGIGIRQVASKTTWLVCISISRAMGTASRSGPTGVILSLLRSPSSASRSKFATQGAQCGVHEWFKAGGRHAPALLSFKVGWA